MKKILVSFNAWCNRHWLSIDIFFLALFLGPLNMLINGNAFMKLGITDQVLKGQVISLAFGIAFFAYLAYMPIEDIVNHFVKWLESKMVAHKK